ncbi:MAG: hypothetical protein WCI27_11020, partial [Candidatus Omnitrophota bacterium]
DYVALKKQAATTSTLDPTENKSHAVASQVMREVIIPEIEKEVNQGQNFAPLRQMFYAMILASWYKLAFKDALLNQVYSDRGKTGGALADDPASQDKIYAQYVQSYKRGVFNYIKEDIDVRSREVMPREYFSGGEKIRLRLGENLTIAHAPSRHDAPLKEGDSAMISVHVGKIDASMTPVFQQADVELQIKQNYAPEKRYSYPSAVIKARDVDGLEDRLKSLWEALREIAKEESDTVDVPDLGELHFTIASKHTAIGASEDDVSVLKTSLTPEALAVHIQEAETALTSAGATAFNSNEALRGALSRTSAGVVYWTMDKDSPFVSWINGLRQGFAGGPWSIYNAGTKEFRNISMSLLRIKKEVSAEKLKAIDDRVAVVIERFSNQGNLELPGPYAVSVVEAGQGNYVNWKTVKVKRISLQSGVGILTGRVLVRSKVEAQISKMYEGGYSDPSILVKLDGSIVDGVRSLYNALRAAVSDDVLDMPEINRLHWSIVSTMKGIKENDHDQYGLPKSMVDASYIQNMLNEAKEKMLNVPLFKGALKGKLLLSDNGVILWVIQSADYVRWMKDQARHVFGQEWYRPDIVHVSLGRIRKSGLSDSELKNIEDKLNEVFQRYAISDGLFEPQGELDVHSIAVGQYDRTGWRLVQEQSFPLSSTDKAMTPGGIDLNARNMGLDVDKDGKGVDMKFDPAMIAEFQQGNFTGVEGIILRIVPLQSPLPILGLDANVAGVVSP